MEDLDIYYYCLHLNAWRNNIVSTPGQITEVVGGEGGGGVYYLSLSTPRSTMATSYCLCKSGGRRERRGFRTESTFSWCKSDLINWESWWNWSSRAMDSLYKIGASKQMLHIVSIIILNWCKSNTWNSVLKIVRLLSYNCSKT